MIISQPITRLKFFVFYFLLLVLPFIGAINYRISNIVAYCMLFIPIFLITILGINKRIYNLARFPFLGVSYFLLFVLFITRLLYKSSVYNDVDLYYEQFFFTSFVYTLILPIILNFRQFLEHKFSLYLKLLFYIIALNTFYEFLIFDIFNLPEYQLMYDKTNITYLDKPFTIFGQPSVTSSIMCFIYLLYETISSKTSKTMLLLLTISILMYRTGTGYLCLLIVIMSKIWKYRTLFIISGLVVLITSFFIVKYNLIYKLSYDYMAILIDLFGDFFRDYFKQIESLSDVFFGVNPVYEVPIDFGPLFYVGNVGLLSFLVFTIFLLYLMFLVKKSSFTFSIIVILIGNLHYPVMFYPLMHVLLACIFYSVFFTNLFGNSDCV